METTDEDRETWQRRMGVGERQSRHHVVAGTQHVEPVRREDNGKVGGFYTHHWSGRTDATVRPDPARIARRVQEVS